MSKILITATNAMVYHFLTPHIENLLQNGYKVELACTDLLGYRDLLNERLRQRSININIKYIRLDRSPYRIGNYKGLKDLKAIIDEGEYDLIWTNEPVMSIATRLAAIQARKNGLKVMYMVHGFHFYKGAALFNWLVYYPIEKMVSVITDCLVTINKEDYERAKNFFFKKIFYIHGIGLDTHKFKNIVVDRNEKRKELGVPLDSTVLLSVGELSSRKNHEVVIKALGRLKNDKIHYIICGEGVLERKLNNLCEYLGVKDNVHFLGYRKDIAEICKSVDIYIFPSQREGLGIGALEGMASGLPLIASDINGIRDYAIDGKTGITVKPHDVEGYALAINRMIKDRKLRIESSNFNEVQVQKFDINNTKKEVLDIISNII